ncbi:MAG TPA: hypothetical protein VLA61_19605 [Ideonella sp.]|uniref:hypothetical protein n=1 Tax=Ideonella sp. TaxID=1929293 RepID=UPI002C512FCE|nr:hypothetical protein [Ideonella sp.]HSI50478.1 hypothetical protein [Ideonella sp.]
MKQITFTYPHPTVTQGQIKRIDNVSADIAIEPGYPDPSIIADPVNFPTQGRYLHRYQQELDPVTGHLSCKFAPDAVDANEALVLTQIPYQANGISQTTQGWWHVDFGTTYSAVRPPPLKVGDYVGIKSKAGVNAYDVRNAAFFRFDSVLWRRKSRGVFGGTNNGGAHAPTQITVTRSSIALEDMPGLASPCLSTPDGGPQFGGTTGFPSSGHIVTDNTFASTGDDAVAFFDATNTEVSRNILADAYSNRAVFFRFSATTAPAISPTQGGAGFTVCTPGNQLLRDSYFWNVGDESNINTKKIACP